MARRLSSLIPSPAIAIALLALLAATGGIALAATSGGPAIHACANKKSGALRISTRCKRNERHVNWNQTGPQGERGTRGSTGPRGLTGFTGGTGAAGAQGVQGVPGPGATTFTTTLPEGPPKKTALASLGNGVTIVGECVAGEVHVGVETASGPHLQISSVESAPKPGVLHDGNGLTSESTSPGPSTDADLTGLARDSSLGGKFAHFEVHGELGSPCTFWGMVIPSS